MNTTLLLFSFDLLVRVHSCEQLAVCIIYFVVLFAFVEVSSFSSFFFGGH